MQQRPANLESLLGALSLPGQDGASLSFSEPTTAAVREYLKGLPFTNPPQLCNKLYASVPELASLRIEASKKQALLDLFNPVVITCTEKLTQNITLNEKNTRILSLSVAILRNLAAGYKAVVVENCKSEEVVPTLLANSIHGALTVMNRLLLTCWQSYIAPPGNFWRELHALYGIAHGFKVDTTPVAANVLQGQTARTAYLKPLLLACANPGHYAPAELRSIFDFLDNCAQLAELVKGPDKGLFVIDPEANTAPVYASRRPHTTNRHLRLRTHKLVNLIKDMQAQTNFKGLPIRIANDLCRYWAEEKVREEEHIEDGTPVVVILGLTRIHRLLTRTKSIEHFLELLDKTHHGEDYQLFDERKPVYKQDMLSAADAWRDAYDTTDRHFQEREHRVREPLLDTPVDFKSVEISKEETRKPLRGYPGVRINVSEKGSCVEFSDPPESLTPGELIAVQEKGQQEWKIAIVRWIHTTPQLKRLAGMEFLPHPPQPCAACLVKVQRPVSPYLPGLLFEVDDDRELVVPSMPFKEHGRVRILSLTGEFITQLKHARDSTFHMSRFTLEQEMKDN